MHIAVIVIAAALCLAGYVYLLRSINEQFQTQHEIKLRLPPDKQFEPTFWSYGTHERFQQRQRDLLAESLRPRRLRRFQLIGFALLASAMLILLAALTAVSEIARGRGAPRRLKPRNKKKARTAALKALLHPKPQKTQR